MIDAILNHPLWVAVATSLLAIVVGGIAVVWPTRAGR